MIPNYHLGKHRPKTATSEPAPVAGSAARSDAPPGAAWPGRAGTRPWRHSTTRTRRPPGLRRHGRWRCPGSSDTKKRVKQPGRSGKTELWKIESKRFWENQGKIIVEAMKKTPGFPWKLGKNAVHLWNNWKISGHLAWFSWETGKLLIYHVGRWKMGMVLKKKPAVNKRWVRLGGIQYVSLWGWFSSKPLLPSCHRRIHPYHQILKGASNWLFRPDLTRLFWKSTHFHQLFKVMSENSISMYIPQNPSGFPSVPLSIYIIISVNPPFSNSLAALCPRLPRLRCARDAFR